MKQVHIIYRMILLIIIGESTFIIVKRYSPPCLDQWLKYMEHDYFNSQKCGLNFVMKYYISGSYNGKEKGELMEREGTFPGGECLSQGRHKRNNHCLSIDGCFILLVGTLRFCNFFCWLVHLGSDQE